MWLITGPFDGTNSGQVDFMKTKLLKCGTKYILGRKAKTKKHIVLSHPKVSAEQLAFEVGGHAPADVTDPSVIPSLQVFNLKERGTSVRRGGETILVNPLSQEDLQDGDCIAIFTGLGVTVRWRPVCCLASPVRGSPLVTFSLCAALGEFRTADILHILTSSIPKGLKVVPTHHPDVTHHLTSTLSVTPAHAVSLVSAVQFVRPDWLIEYLRLGTPDTDDSTLPEADLVSPLENEYFPPAETKYRPPFAPMLPVALKTFRTWQPDETRVGMFRGWQFVFIGAAEVEMRQLVLRGGGVCEVLDMAGGKTRWQQSLRKAKKKADAVGGKGLALVADEGLLRAAGEETWTELLDVFRISGLRFVSPTNLLESVVHIDPSRIDSALAVDADEGPLSLPDFVPNTHPEEPCVPPEIDSMVPARRSLRRRAPSASRALSAPPQEQPVAAVVPSGDDDEPVRPRRTLTRRAKERGVLVGVDDPSVVESQPFVLAAVGAASSADVHVFKSTKEDFPPSAPRSTKLKRRAGTAAASSIFDNLTSDLENDAPEPPLKKFKALFDEADPDRASQLQTPGSGSIDSQTSATSPVFSHSESVLPQSCGETPTQTERGSTIRSGSKMPLRAVPEEMEESQETSNIEEVPAVAGSRLKRRAGDEVGSDTQAMKKRAVEEVNAVKPASQATRPQPSAASQTAKLQSTTQPMLKPCSTVAPGAAAGKPDTDAAFLKALASTKKGKLAEDITDREFNNLRISKPDVRQEAMAKELAVLHDFGDDRNLRGNFMVIVEMDLPELGDKPSCRRAETRPEWQGKPDFKKFKRKDQNRHRVAIELVVDDENDYGMGSTYWTGNSQLPLQSQSQPESHGADLTAYLQPTQSRNPPRPGAQSKPPSKWKPQSKLTSQTQTRASQPGKSRAFRVMDSDASDDEPPPSPVDNARSRSRAPRFRQEEEQAKPLFLESDGDKDHGDDMGVLEGDADESTLWSSNESRGNKTSAASRRKAPTLVVDDDSDTGMQFKGRKKPRR